MLTLGSGFFLEASGSSSESPAGRVSAATPPSRRMRDGEGPRGNAESPWWLNRSGGAR